MRIMLDTNLWSYLGDQRAGPSFYRIVLQSDGVVVIPPSMLLEVARTPLPAVRRRIVDAMLAGPREQLPSEAETSCAEVVAEMRRLRPEWLLRFPKTDRVASLHAFWTRRIWRIASDSRLDKLATEATAKWRAEPAQEMLKMQRLNRPGVVAGELDVRSLHWWSEPVVDAPAWYVDGWTDRRRVEDWRVHCRDVYWHSLCIVASRSILTREDTTHADWIGAFVDLEQVRRDRASFTRFWLDEVALAAVPRNWLRWACHLAQQAFKINDGNPYDSQHASYLPDCDLFLTADRRFAEALDLVRQAAEFEMPEIRHVAITQETSIVDVVAAAIAPSK